MKTLFAALAVLALTGCATPAPISTYRAPGQIDSWKISGEYNALGFGLSISINGKKIIEDSMASFYGNTKTFEATYEGKPVMAECEYKVQLFSQKMQCMVFVGNERATTLTF